MHMIGVPESDRAQAYRMTLAGYGGNLVRYGEGTVNSTREAVEAVRGSIQGGPFSRINNPYGRVLTARMFHPGRARAGLSGLGDGDEIDWSFVDTLPTPPAPKPYVSSAGTGWLDVVNTVVGNLSRGVAQKISGPPKITVTQAPRAPGWVAPAAIAGGVGVLYLLLRRR